MRPLEKSAVSLERIACHLSLCPWWAIYRESRGIIVLENRLNQICLNLKSSLAARLELASTKLEIAGRLILLICFDPFHIVGGFSLILLLVLEKSRVLEHISMKTL